MPTFEESKSKMPSYNSKISIHLIKLKLFNGEHSEFTFWPLFSENPLIYTVYLKEKN